jgi:hypothetical protein
MPLYLPAQSQGRWLTTLPGGVANTSQAFTVGRVLLNQFVVPATCRADGIAYTVGSTSAGNVTGGIVGPVALTADISDAAAVVAQSASTPQSTANSAQVLTWTAVTLRAGIYYAVLEGDNATGTYMRHSAVAQAIGISAQYDRAGGYGALTDPTPTSTIQTGIVPGLRIRLAA